MRLIDVCEPFFLYASSLKRAGLSSASPRAAEVRSAVKNIYGEMRAAAARGIHWL